MERLNLNIPADTRRALRDLAREAGKREAEFARGLLVGAVERALRHRFWAQAAAAQTPERRARDIAMARSFEDLGG